MGVNPTRKQTRPNADPDAPKVEVRLTRNATARFNFVRQAVHDFITTSFGAVIFPSKAIEGWETNPVLESSVERIYASEFPCPDRSIQVSQADLHIHVFQPYPDDTYDEMTGGGDGEEEVVSATVTEMPSRSLEGLWESLIYSDGVKAKLLDYIYATILFSDADVDCKDYSIPNTRTFGEVYLTVCIRFRSCSQCRVMEQSSSPPRSSGDGKNFSLPGSSSETLDPTFPQVSTPQTAPLPIGVRNPLHPSAQPLERRMFTPPPPRYNHARLLEINAHSLFSKWFSESGKLVQSLFGSVMEMIEEGDRFVVVLIGTIVPLPVH